MKTNNGSRLIQFLCLCSLVLNGCHSPPANNISLPPANGKQTAPPVQVERLAESETVQAASLIAAYNARDIGSPGWRRVSMNMVTDGSVTRSFQIINLWRGYGNDVRILFLLEEPTALCGTNYLLEESADVSPNMQVYLFLPAGQRRVLTLAPGNFGHGLLGSDFTYNDVRLLLPTAGYRYDVLGHGMLANEPVWVIEAEPSELGTREMVSWSKARLYLSREHPILLGADYYGPSTQDANTPSVLKQMRVESFKGVNGVWTATHIVMTAGNQNRTELTLQAAEFNTNRIRTDLFSPAQLPLLADSVQRGWTPETAIEPTR